VATAAGGRNVTPDGGNFDGEAVGLGGAAATAAGDLAGNVYIWEADQTQPQRVILVQPKE